MTHIALRLTMAFLTLLTQAPAFADAHEAPMTFVVGEYRDSIRCDIVESCSVHAFGEIEQDSADRLQAALNAAQITQDKGARLTLYIESLGGDIDAAIRLGTLVRKYGFRVDLSRKERPGTVCRGTSKFYFLENAFPDWANFDDRKCRDVVFWRVPTRCESACTLIYAAGTLRSMGVAGSITERIPIPPKDRATDTEKLGWLKLSAEDVEYLRGKTFYQRIVEGDQTQRQLGFHLIQPTIKADPSPEMRDDFLRYGAEWGQQELIKVSDYFASLKVDPQILAFSNKAPNDEAKRYYYPSKVEIEQAGLLNSEKWNSVRLELQGGETDAEGMSLTSSLVNSAGIRGYANFFCRDTSQGQPDYAVAITLFGTALQYFRTDAPTNSASLITFDSRPTDFHHSEFFPSLPDSQTKLTVGATVKLDGEVLISAQTDYSRQSPNFTLFPMLAETLWLPDPADSQPKVISTSALSKFPWDPYHVILKLSSEEFEQLRMAKEVEVTFSPFSLPPLKIDMADDMRRNFGVLKRNCFPRQRLH